jgi:hypothetical protein
MPIDFSRARPGSVCSDLTAHTENPREVKEFEMHSNLIRHHAIIRQAALTLLVVCFAQQGICAQQPEGKSATTAGHSEPDEVRAVRYSYAWVLIRGQTARISVVNPNEPSEREQRQTVFIQVVLFDADGAVIAESDEIAILPGKFCSVDFNRDALSLAGEPGSGRLQTRAQVRYRSFYLLDRTRAIGFPTAIELIDNLTGQTQSIGRWWVRLSRSTDPGL